MPEILSVNKTLAIPISELRFRFARSGGRGGQNVNKVETRVELLFDVVHSSGLSETDREKILKHLKSRIDSNGILRIVAQESRSQWRNRQDAMERFVVMLQDALKPRKKRVATKMTGAGKERRLREKKRRSEVKNMRRIRED